MASTSLDRERYIERALASGIGPGERAWAWRLFLGVIPESGDPASVEAALSESRARYEALQKQHLPDVSSASGEDSDPLSCMLAPKEDGWSRFYASADLRAEIEKDLERLVMAGLADDHFTASTFRESMLTVLTVWSTAHSDVGYRQGMHEIAALVALVLEDEAAYGCRDADREADCYALFEAVMKDHKQYFRADKGQKAPVLEACRRASGEALAKVDPRLARFLEDNDLEPQLYGLRWARLLFSREVPAPANLALCDALFALARHKAKPLSEIIEIFIVALLVTASPRLLAADDPMDALQMLMRPGLVDVPDLVKNAIKVANGDFRPSHIPALRDHPVSRTVDDHDDVLGDPDHELGDLLQSALATLSKYANTPEAIAALDQIRFVSDRLRTAPV